MAYCMSKMNENQKNYLQAVKFFKRFYFCSKLLDDAEGVEIALNKISICYHLSAKFDQSMAFAFKHMKFIDDNCPENEFGKMIAIYNYAIAMR
jgi:hypothetical protein